MEVSGQLHALAYLPPGKEPLVTLDRRLGGPQSRSGRCGIEKYLLPLPRNRTQDVQPVARRYSDSYTLKSFREDYILWSFRHMAYAVLYILLSLLHPLVRILFLTLSLCSSLNGRFQHPDMSWETNVGPSECRIKIICMVILKST
jgi:hypothetical protein